MLRKQYVRYEPKLLQTVVNLKQTETEFNISFVVGLHGDDASSRPM